MSFIRSDTILKIKNFIREVSKETIAQSIQLFEMIVYFMIEAFLLAPYIAIKLDVLQKILRKIDFVNLYVLLIID